MKAAFFLHDKTTRPFSTLIIFAPSVCIIPWRRASFDNGLDCTLESDGRILMNSPGLFRVSLGVDWVAQQGADIDLRKVGIRCHRAGTAARARPAAPPAIDKYDDHFASCDTPGSSVPKTGRWQGPWTPGMLAPGATATLQVEVTTRNPVMPGDLALASHNKINDAQLGAAGVDALLVQARVVARNTVRVTVTNLLGQVPVTIPPGQLNVLAMTAVDTCGESNDAWHVLHSPTEVVNAGDRLYAVCRTLTDGDYLQHTDSTFLQIEKVG